MSTLLGLYNVDIVFAENSSDSDQKLSFKFTTYTSKNHLSYYTIRQQ